MLGPMGRVAMATGSSRAWQAAQTASRLGNTPQRLVAAATMGRMAVGGIAGGLTGLMTGPSDSRTMNIVMGSLAGAAGARMGHRIGTSMGARLSKTRAISGMMSRGPEWLRRGTSLLRSRTGGQLGPTMIGASASALFVPSMAHFLLGGSRHKKTQATLNRY